MDNTLSVSLTQANKPLIRHFHQVLRPMAAVVLMLVIGSALTGCGFKPRSTVTLPPELTRIDLEVRPNNADLDYQLGQTFVNKEIKISDHSETLLIIESERISKRNGAISPQGWVVEYLLNYSLTFSLYHNKKLLIKPTQLKSERSYQFSENQISGRNDEEQSLIQDMRRETINQMLRIIGQRLTTELQQPATEQTPHETQS